MVQILCQTDILTQWFSHNRERVSADRTLPNLNRDAYKDQSIAGAIGTMLSGLRLSDCEEYPRR